MKSGDTPYKGEVLVFQEVLRDGSSPFQLLCNKSISSDPESCDEQRKRL